MTRSSFLILRTRNASISLEKLMDRRPVLEGLVPLVGFEGTADGENCGEAFGDDGCEWGRDSSSESSPAL